MPQQENIDGLDRLQQFTGAEDNREDLYFEWGNTRAVRTKRWKYISWRHTPEEIEKMKNGEVQNAFNMSGKQMPDYCMHFHPDHWDADQLYDLSVDPDERLNLWGSPRLKNVQADMVSRLRKHLDTFDNPYPEKADAYIGSHEHWQLACNSLSDDRIFNNYFFRDKAF